jgi:predicted  nucleic acid-binding Zn-ribbon protein
LIPTHLIAIEANISDSELVHFPLIESLHVDSYRLYPGKDGQGLNSNFGPGPWIILGVNGLGKSTLLLLLRYVLVGNVRVRDAGFAGEETRDLLSADSRLFASRVNDGARSATARLKVRVGQSTFVVTRRLENLSLISFLIDGRANALSTEESYRSKLAEAFEISDFANVVRLVDRMVFTFLENEAALIWDTASQYEIFRALVLKQEDSVRLRELEGTIVSADSAARNLNAVLYGIIKRQDKDRSLKANAATVKAQLAKANADLAAAQERESTLQLANEAAEIRRSDARTRLYQAERAADESEGRYEQAKFAILNAALASATPTQKYVVLKLLSENECIACGSNAAEAVSEIERRSLEGKCLMCGSKLAPAKSGGASRKLARNARNAYAELQAARTAIVEAQKEFSASEGGHKAAIISLQAIREEVYRLERSIGGLIRKLPKKDRLEIAREKDRVKGLRDEVTRFRQDRAEAEEEIAGLIAAMRHEVEAIRARIEASFQRRARQFFTERVRLVYAPRKDRIGQQGTIFDFPAFEIDMTSGATDGEYTRRSIDSISLSQRQYLDIIFRLSVMEVFGRGGHSFVVDGPETSLDAVFAGRAGNLLAAFAQSGGKNPNNLIVACNVVEGDFIPGVLKQFDTVALKRVRLINLLELGKPTAALRDLSSQYTEAVKNVLRGK